MPDAAGGTAPRYLSLDAWVAVSPSSAFRYSAARRANGSAWRALRRPLFLALALGCAVSLVATGVLTARIAATATLFWTFVPTAELVALAVVMRGRRGGVPWSQAVDIFFAGHAPWTLLVIIFGATLAFTSPARWWGVVMGPGISAMTLVIAWSACIDFCFFRSICGASRLGAVRDVILNRLVAWTMVFAVFAVPVVTPSAVLEELIAAFEEIAA